MSNPISVRCPQCGARLKLKSRKAVGKKASCPKCGNAFVVQPPRAAADEADTPDESASFAAQDPDFGQPVQPQPLPPLPSQRRSQPRKTPSSQGWQKPALLAGAVLVAVGLAVGVVLWSTGPDSPEQPAPAATASTETGDSATATAGGAGDSTDRSKPASRQNALDLAYLPPEAGLIASIRLAALWNAPLLESLRKDPSLKQPLQRVESALSAMGLPPGKIDRVLIGMKSPVQSRSTDFDSRAETAESPQGSLGGFGAASQMTRTLTAGVASIVIRSREAIDEQQILQFVRDRLPPEHEIESAAHRGTTYYRIPSPMPQPVAQRPAGGASSATGADADGGGAGSRVAAAFLPDDRTLVLCTEPHVRSFIERGAETSRHPEFDFVDPAQHLLLVASPEVLSLSKPTDNAAGPPVPPFLRKLRSIAFGLTSAEGVDLQLRGRFADGETAQSAVRELESLLQTGREQFAAWKGESAPGQFAAVWDLVESVLQGAAVSRADAVVEVTGSVPDSAAGTLQQLPGALLAWRMSRTMQQTADAGPPAGFRPSPMGQQGPSAMPEESGPPDDGAAERTSETQQPASASAEADEVADESLQTKLSLSFEEPFGLFPPDDQEPLFATVELTGQPAAEATHYGFLKITTATVEGDEPLQQVASRFSMNNPAEQFVEIDRNMMFAGQFEKPEDAIRLHLMLEQPPSAAERLQVLDGSLQLMTGGDRKQVTVPGIAQKVGQTLNESALQAANLNIRVIDPNQAKVTFPDATPEQMVSLVIRGPETALLDLELVDGDGTALETQAGWSGGSSSGTPLSYTLQAKGSLPPDAALRLSLAVNQKRVEVPFRFEDVPLPGPEGSTTAGAVPDSGGERPVMPGKAAPDQSPKMAEFQPRARLNLRGHIQGVNGAAVSPDGKFLASAGERGKIKVWDLQTVEVRAVCTGHQGAVRCVEFSPDGRLLASGGNDKTVRLWNPRTGEPVRVIGRHWNEVLSADFSPDGARLATGGRDWTVRLWDVDSGRKLGTLKGHVGWIHAVAFSPDGRWLASAAPRPAGRDDGGEVILWDPASEVSARITYGEHENVEIVSREIRARMTGHAGGAEHLAFLPDGARLLTGSRTDETVRLWTLPSGEQDKQWDAAMGPLAVSPDGRYAAFCTGKGRVQLRNTATGHVPADWEAHDGEVKSMAIFPDGTALVTAGADNVVKVWTVPGAEGEGRRR